ncbi:MAG TPA: polyprenyl synthetase family protein, partial [Sphingomonas sp.]
MSATIHRFDSASGREPSLEPMLQLVAGDLNSVNAVILDRMQSQIP